MGLVNPLKRKICDENIFPVNVEWSAKNLWKMISADEISRTKRYSDGTDVYKKYLQNLKYNVKGYAFFIWFWLVFYIVC